MYIVLFVLVIAAVAGFVLSAVAEYKDAHFSLMSIGLLIIVFGLALLFRSETGAIVPSILVSAIAGCIIGVISSMTYLAMRKRFD